MTQDTAIEAWVDRFRDDRDNQYVSEQHVQRAAAIIRLIGTSALSRGFAVPPPDDGDLLRMHREDVIWAHIVCATDDGVTYFLRVQEVCAPNAPRKPPAAVGADPHEPRWLACRVREFIGTGLLQISIRTDGDVACRRSAKDTATSSLEEKIPSAFNEFASAMERRRKDRRERAEWEEAKRRARERYACDRLMADMDHQAEQYLAMARRREFLSALERALERYEGADRVQVARRIALLRERVDAEDPGLHPERIDIAVPEPDDARLAPYMDGWSVDGPYRISSMEARERTRRIESPWPQETGAYGGGTVGAMPDYAGPYGTGAGRYGEPDF